MEQFLIGNLGVNPDIRTTSTGKKMALFSIATHHSYKNTNGEWTKNVTWHKLVAWGKVAIIVEKVLKKGQMVLVSGSLNNRSYEDPQGETKYFSQVVVNHFERLSKGKSSEQKESDDGLPF